MQTPHLVELQIADYLRMIARHKLLFVAVLAATVIAAITFTNRQTPLYASSVDVMIELESRTDAINGVNGTRIDSSRLLENEVGFLESLTVVQAVTDALGIEPDVRIAASGNRDFITLTATATDPIVAATTANTYAQTYLDLRRDAAVNDLFETSSVVQTQVDSLDAQIADIDAAMDAEIAQLEAGAAQRSLDGEPIEPSDVERLDIERRFDEVRQPLVSQRLIYAQYLTTVQLNADLTSGAVGRIVSPAEPPATPSSPQPARNTALGVVLGLFLAAGATLIRHNMRDVVGESGSTEAIADTPLLATIPTFARRLSNGLVTRTTPDSVSAEAFRSLRTAVVFSALTDEKRVIQVTSPSMAEGKSETAANLAVSLAQAGHSVILIDADLRRPTVGRKLGIDDTAPGLSSVLAQSELLNDCLVLLDDVPLLTVLPAGPMPEDPAAFVGSQTLQSLVRYLRKHFDFVVIDSPPVGLVSDPLTISRHADAVMVVVRSQKTRRRDLVNALASLRRINAPILGLVLNGTRRGRSYGRGYYSDRKRSQSRQMLDLDTPRLRSPLTPADKDAVFSTTEGA